LITITKLDYSEIFFVILVMLKEDNLVKKKK